MLKTDINIVLAHIRTLLIESPSKYYIKIHKMYQPMPVFAKWEIEPNRINTDIHLMYVIKGKGTYTLGTEKIAMKKGQLYVVSNGYPHSVSSDQDDLVHIFSMRFGIYRSANHTFMPDFFKEPFGTVIIPKEPDIYHDLLAKAYRHYLEQTPIIDCVGNTIMTHLLLNLCESRDHLDSTTQVDTLTNLIIQKHGTHITVTDLAERMNLSTKQFTRLFVKSNHMTPHQFIITTRIHHAKYLLDETNLSIKSIADELGYADAFTFSRQFKKVAGQGPSAYRG